jgi:lipopolysaccharide export system protein LptA
MTWVRFWVVTGMALAMALPRVAAAAEGAAAAKKEVTAEAEQITVVTSERLTFDYKKHYALFEQNVMVTDPEMQMAADQLMIRFDESGKATSIKAEGRVTITQTDKTAQANLATYDLETGKIVLAGKPRVTRGKDTLEGETITFWRDDNRMICQPNARLVIYPEKGSGAKDQLQLLGE